MDTVTTKHDYRIKSAYAPEAQSCIQCGVVGQLYRHGTREQHVMDTPAHGKRVGITVVRTRWRCKACGKTFLQPLPDVADNGTMTKRLMAYMEEASLRRPFTHIAEEIGVTEGTVRNVFNAYVDHLDATVKFETPEVLGIDEVHFLRHMRCVLTNIKAGSVIGLLEDRNRKTVNEFLFWMPDKERVKVVTMDMWRPYRDAVKAVLPDAQVVVDKFHVVRMATQAVESVRRGLRDSMNTTARRKMMRSRYLLLKRNTALNAEDRETVDDWTANFPALLEAYRAKEAFLDIWDNRGRQEAENGLQVWRATLPPSMSSVFKPLITALDNWHDEILSYWDHRETNALTEALNGIAKIINRQGRGYSFKAIRAKLLYAKRLQVQRPSYGKDEIVLMADPDDIEIYGRDDIPTTPLKGTSVRRLGEFLEGQVRVESPPRPAFDRNSIHIQVNDGGIKK